MRLIIKICQIISYCSEYSETRSFKLLRFANKNNKTTLIWKTDKTRRRINVSAEHNAKFLGLRCCESSTERRGHPTHRAGHQKDSRIVACDARSGTSRGVRTLCRTYSRRRCRAHRDISASTFCRTISQLKMHGMYVHNQKFHSFRILVFRDTTKVFKEFNVLEMLGVLLEARYLQSLWNFVYRRISTCWLQIWPWKLTQMISSRSKPKKTVFFTFFITPQ